MTTEKNKILVRRINKEFIEGGNMNAFWEIFAEDFINYTAPPGMLQIREGVIYFFNNFLKEAFPNLTVEIHDMIAEGDKVSTRKSFYGTHKGEFMGLAPTGKNVVMDVIDVLQFREEKCVAHWGMLDLNAVMAQLRTEELALQA